MQNGFSQLGFEVENLFSGGQAGPFLHCRLRTEHIHPTDSLVTSQPDFQIQSVLHLGRAVITHPGTCQASAVGWLCRSCLWDSIHI